MLGNHSSLVFCGLFVSLSQEIQIRQLRGWEREGGKQKIRMYIWGWCCFVTTEVPLAANSWKAYKIKAKVVCLKIGRPKHLWNSS